MSCPICPVVADVDTRVDDALAFLLADPCVDLRALTCVEIPRDRSSTLA